MSAADPAARSLGACALTWGQVLALIGEFHLTAERAHRKQLDAGLIEIERYWQATEDAFRLAAETLRTTALVADAARERTPHP